MIYRFWGKYMGVTFPSPILNCSDTIVENYEKQSARLLQGGLEEGRSLEEQGILFEEQLQNICFFLQKYQGFNPQKMKKRLEQKLGQSWEMIQCIWFMNIGGLLQLKKISQDKQNGWMIEQNKVKV